MSDKNPIIYLASPYSNPDESIMEYRYLMACQAAALLIKQGFVVYSPIAHSHVIAKTGLISGDWHTWERQCIAMLDACSYMLVLTLPGWQHSVGIAAEIRHCDNRSIPVLLSDFLGLKKLDLTQFPQAIE